MFCFINAGHVSIVKIRNKRLHYGLYQNSLSAFFFKYFVFVLVIFVKHINSVDLAISSQSIIVNSRNVNQVEKKNKAIKPLKVR